jgi:diguanylate cyclase
MRIQGQFLTSQLARRIFFGAFSLALVVLLLVGGVFYQLGNQLVRNASTEVLRESTRAFGRNLVDRLVAGEALLLQIARRVPAHEPAEIELDPSLRRMFSSIRVTRVSPIETYASGKSPATPSKIDTVGGSAYAFPEVVLTVRPPASGIEVRATFTADYIWDPAQSGLYSLCAQAGSASRTHCDRAESQRSGALQVQRSLLFQPFFEAKPWTLTATASPELSQLLPFGLGQVAVAICIFAFLLALVSTSIYLRKLTGSLNALMSVTRKVSVGDFGRRVPLHALQGELHELGSAFNQMISGLEANHQFHMALSEIDACILARKPLEEAIGTALRYANLAAHGCRVNLRTANHEERLLFTITSGGQLSIAAEARSEFLAEHERPCDLIALGQVDGRNLQLEIECTPNAVLSTEVRSRLGDLGKKLAIAAEASAHERHLSLQATTDSLTGLLNRFGFMERLGELVTLKTWGKPLAVVFYDLDGFKEVNDAYGHSVGDALLQGLALRTKADLRALPCVQARLGGDEFAYIFKAADLAHGVSILRSVLAEPTLAANRSITLSASLGSAEYPSDADSPEELLRKADLAMYKCKADGGNSWHAYTPNLEGDVAERLELIRDLRAAIPEAELQVYYQPRVSAISHEVKSVEALMRWRHPTRGWISPSVFIPLAEQSGIIGALGDWILDRACHQVKTWRAQGVGITQISVNVSPFQMKSAEFFDHTAALLARYELPPGSIELEITEGALVENIQDTVPRLQKLQAAGFHIALDDFGVGYSALSYLSRIPFDTLKIDQSFVSEMHDDVSHAIVQAIVTLAKAMGKHMVAEGVEQQTQCEMLELLGVHELQGYHFGKPVPCDVLTIQLKGSPLETQASP